MSYEIDGRNLIVSSNLEAGGLDSAEGAAGYETGDGFRTVVGLVGLAIGILAIIYGAPVSLYCLGAAAVAFVLGLARRPLGDRDMADSLLKRLVSGLLGDSKTAALLLALGLAVVWFVQIALNLFGSPGDAAAVGAAELQIYEWGDRLNEAGSARNMLMGLAFAAFCSVMASASWPIVMLGFARRALSAAIALFAAMSSFSFVAPAALVDNYETVIGSVRAQIVGELERIAQARSEQAALQWLASELSRESAQHPQAARQWRAYFAEIERDCSVRLNCHSRQLIVQLARQRTSPRSPYEVFRITEVRQPSAWLPEFRSAIARPGAHGADPVAHAASDPPRLELSGRFRRSRDLFAMRRSVSSVAVRATAARDAFRGVVVEAVGEMLGPNFNRLAGEVVDVWRDAILDVFATEGEMRIARRLRTLDIPMKGSASAAAEFAHLTSRDFPLESPRQALQRAGSIEALVQADWEAMYAREAGPVATDLPGHVPTRAPNPDGHRLGYTPEPHRPPARPAFRPPRIPFR